VCVAPGHVRVSFRVMSAVVSMCECIWVVNECEHRVVVDVGSVYVVRECFV
jgi:hypothetical protein